MRIKHTSAYLEDSKSTQSDSKIALALSITTIISLALCASVVMLYFQHVNNREDIQDLKNRVDALEKFHEDDLLESDVPGYYSPNCTIEFEGHTESFYNTIFIGDAISRANELLETDYNVVVREDGVATFGGYVIVAADYTVHPYGSIINTSQGEGMVLDSLNGEYWHDYERVEIATTWTRR